MKFYFCEMRQGYFLGCADDIESQSEKTLRAWVRNHPRRQAIACDDDRLDAAKANSAREELRLMAAHARWQAKSGSYECHASSC